MNWLRNFFITKIIKSLLDNLPLNGRKTYLGLILFVLTIVQYVWPDNYVKDILQAIIDLLKDMDAGDILNMTVASIITGLGLGHKWLKEGDEK